MSCRSAIRQVVVATALALIGAAPALKGQEPTTKQRTPAIIALLRDPSGAKVHNARGWLRTEPAWHLEALQGAALPGTQVPGLAGSLPRAHEIEATSDERGVLRFPIPEGSMAAAGTGIVTTGEGLGALLPRLHQKRTPLVTLEPMALVTTETGSEAFSLVARATLADGTKITLPLQRGKEVRLPAGDYEVWACGRDGLVWQRMQLQPGQRARLRFSGAAQRLRLSDDAYVHPAGLPRLSLHTFIGPDFAGDDGEVALRGAALAAPWISWRDGIVTPARVVPGPPSDEARPWPPRSDRLDRSEVHLLADGTSEQAVLLGLTRQEDRSFRVVAYARNEAGRCRMPRAPAGDNWLLLLAPDKPAMAHPWSRPSDRPLRLQRGQSMTIRARDRRSLPIADLLVTYTPEDQDAATVVARTDATGVAHFGHVAGPGLLQVSDARYLNRDLPLELIPTDTLPLTIEDGESLTASVRFADGHDSEAIVVTLRDPSNELRPRQRSVVAAVGEPFSFYGLPSERTFLLIATAQRDGKTWSARRPVNALDEDVVITLQNEDPVLRGNGR